MQKTIRIDDFNQFKSENCCLSEKLHAMVMESLLNEWVHEFYIVAVLFLSQNKSSAYEKMSLDYLLRTFDTI